MNSDAAEKIACFDLSGTLVHHDNRTRPIPFMPALARTMQDEGWQLYIVTSWSLRSARNIMEKSGLTLDCEIRPAVNKAPAVRQILSESPEADRIVFIDDKPGHVKDVGELDDDRIRSLGFIGSRKYCPNLAKECADAGLELVLSAADLAPTLMVDISDVKPDRQLTAEEWASLVPGLDHPFTVPGRLWGEEYFECDLPFEKLQEESDRWWEQVWPQMGWITCRKCLFKTLIETVCAAAGKNMQPIWGKPDQIREYLPRWRHLKPEHKADLEPHFESALSELVRGIRDIGARANQCRPRRGYEWDMPRDFPAEHKEEWFDRAKREFDPDRLEWCFDLLENAYQDSDWFCTIRQKLQNEAVSAVK